MIFQWKLHISMFCGYVIDPIRDVKQVLLTILVKWAKKEQSDDSFY